MTLPRGRVFKWSCFREEYLTRECGLLGRDSQEQEQSENPSEAKTPIPVIAIPEALLNHLFLYSLYLYILEV